MVNKKFKVEVGETNARIPNVSRGEFFARYSNGARPLELFATTADGLAGRISSCWGGPNVVDVANLEGERATACLTSRYQGRKDKPMGAYEFKQFTRAYTGVEALEETMVVPRAERAQSAVSA